jgi:hypothetical protein
MLTASKLKELKRLSRVICNPSLPECHLGYGEYRLGVQNLKRMLAHLFELNAIHAIHEVTNKQISITERSTLENITHSTEEFLDTFFEKLQVLLCHSFTAIQQSTFQNELKLALTTNEYRVVCDFAENYSFVAQDEVQPFHWNNASDTIHPYGIYFKNADNTLGHTSYVVI